MNAVLKRMFEDGGYSAAEAELHAAILGKSYAECKEEWEREYKKEFVLANAVSLIGQPSGIDRDSGGTVRFVIETHYYEDIFENKISACGNVEMPNTNTPAVPAGMSICGVRAELPMHIAVSFYAHELDKDFFMKLNDELIKSNNRLRKWS